MNLALPAVPVLIERFVDGQITGVLDLTMQTDPEPYFDADRDAWEATEWRIRDTVPLVTVWQTGFLSSPPLTFCRVDISDGAYGGPLAGAAELDFGTKDQSIVRYGEAITNSRR